MKFQNVTNKEEFLKAYENGIYEIETFKIQDDGTKVYQISDNRFNRVSWLLSKHELGYEVSYHDNYEPFTVYFAMDGNTIEIKQALQNGKCYKAQKFLKKFTHVCMFANCFINFGLCN